MQNQSQQRISIKDNIAPSFRRVHLLLKNSDYTYFWLKGGRGSTKSSFVAIEIIHGMMLDGEANALVLRKVSNTLRTSVYEHLKWAINILGVSHLWKDLKTTLEFEYLPTGQKIILKGADETDKIKGIKLANGYFKYAWFEELAEFHNAKEVRTILQSILRGGDDYNVFMTYNPPPDEYNWVNQEAKKSIRKRYVHSSTYLDVPEKWLGKQFIEDAEDLRSNDFDAYRHEYLGDVIGNTEKLVMAGRWRVGTEQEFMKVMKQGLDGPLYGADWGYSVDPNVLVRLFIDWDHVYYDEKYQKQVNRPRIFVTHAKYGYKTELEQLPDLFKQVPDAVSHTIRGDSARPETISYLRNNGFPKMVSVKKWAGSVEDGIAYMRGFEWVIHPDLVEAIEEAKNWSYKVHKSGDVLAKLEDGWDHFWDAARYALTPLIKQYKVMKEETIVGITTGGTLGEVVV